MDRNCIFFLVLLLAGVCNTGWSQDGKIVRSTTYFYTKDSVQIADSVLKNVDYYDNSGVLKKREEIVVVRGKPGNHATGLYKDENTLLALYHNDKLISQLDYDSLGTVIREWALINRGKDSFVTVYTPHYKNGRLQKREQVMGNTIRTEEYQYFEYVDSLVIINRSANDVSETFTRTCYNSRDQLVYKESVARGRNGNQFYRSFKFTHAYDYTGRKTEYVRMSNNKIEEIEKFNYQGDRRTFSVKTNAAGRLISKTIYE